MSPLSRRPRAARRREPLSRHLLLLSSGAGALIAMFAGRRRAQGQAGTPAVTADAETSAVTAMSSPPPSHTEVYASTDGDTIRGWLGDPRRCVTVDCLLIALALATALVCALDTHSVAALLLLLAAACVVPGSALLTLLPTEDELEAFALAIGLGFTIEAIGALAMIWTGWWHPFGWAIALAVAACAMLALDARRNALLGGGSR